MRQATTHKIRWTRTGKVYWVQHRIGFRGHEFNAGGGWRPAMREAFEAAQKSGALSEVSQP